MDAPQTWHHGLIARWWAEFNLGGEDIACFQRVIEESGEPALDLGCGAGRLLVPFLAAGLDVDGCDLSADMLAWCRDRAEREGLVPQLFEQPMSALELPRRYRTIVICGSFGIGGTRADDLETLRRAHEHLEPGGTLAFDLYLPNFDDRGWQGWLGSHRRELPAPWPDRGDRRQASDGSELQLTARIREFDPLDQTLVRELRAEHFVGGELVAREEHPLRINIYFKQEVQLMLAHAGFAHTEVRAGLERRPPKPFDDAHLMFVATKAA